MTMTMTDRVVALSTTFLPLDQARRVLLPPVRVARAGAVVVARTVRHWELMLEGGTSSPELDDLVTSGAERPSTPITAAPAGGSATSATSAAELPVEDWPELSYADAQSRLATCDEADLRTLLEYERSHGHRPQYTLLLEQRLATSA